MSTVRLRPNRSLKADGGREVQGMLAMQGLERVRETEMVRRESPGEQQAPRNRRRPHEIRPLPYRAVLAGWPDDWRERWGHRANALEDSGLSWRDAEGRAFIETLTEFRASGDVERN